MSNEQCAYYLDKKKRYCRFRPNSGQKFCAEHIGVLGIPTNRKRIVCPLDSKHTCYEDQLSKHLKKCRKQQGELPIYHCPGINSGESEELEEKIILAEVSTEKIKQLIEKVDILYEKHIQISTEILSHPCLKEELSNSQYGIPAIRHRKQQASLIGHLDKMKLITDNMTYVELGAGKGMLSHWIQMAGVDKKNCNYILVDRGTCRYKADNFHKWEDKGPKFERIRIDIEHLNLGKVQTLSESSNPVVAVGKHLCGSATDLAVRCITETLSSKNSRDEPEEKRLKTNKCEKFGGLSIALCCHHRCQWKPYVGKKFFLTNGLSARDFGILCKLSSWTAGTWTGWKSVEEMNISLGTTQESNRLETKGDQTNNPTTRTEEISKIQSTDVSKLACSSSTGNDQDSTDSESEDLVKEKSSEALLHKRTDLNMSVAEREEVGRKCKRLIDYGRLQYLKDQGLNSYMKVYIEEQLTPENVAIFATPFS